MVYGWHLISSSQGLNTTEFGPVSSRLTTSAAFSWSEGAPWGLVVVASQAGGSILISRLRQRASAARQWWRPTPIWHSWPSPRRQPGSSGQPSPGLATEYSLTTWIFKFMFDLLISYIRAAVTKNISGRKRRKRSFDNQGILKVFNNPCDAYHGHRCYAHEERSIDLYPKNF